jgi:hypothetical protein
MKSRFALVVPMLAVLAVGGCKKDSPASDADAANGQLADATAVAPSAPAHGTPMPLASIEQFVNPKKLPAYQGPTGSIEGTISVTGDPSPPVDVDVHGCPGADRVYGKLFREGPPTHDGGRAVADAIIGVTGYAGFYIPERNEARTVTIDDCAPPRVIDMTVGQRLEVKNNTNQMWAPALEQAQLPALMVATPGSEAVRLYPPRPGHFVLIDKLAHTYARSDVWVLMYPLHAVSDLQGHFRIDGVPVGKMTVSARLTTISQEASKEVEVLANVVQKVDLSVHYAAPKDAGAPAAKADAGRVVPVIK